MNKASLVEQALHLRQVEKLSCRQIAAALGIGYKRVRRILHAANAAKPLPKKSLLEDYRHVIEQWYQQYPRLKATQVYERLNSYGYSGSYMSVVRASRRYRRQKPQAYHPLVFLPGEEAQVDWFFFNHPRLGKVAGFLYVLAYSRYAWGIFYPRTTFEFFLAGHLECFHHIGGLAHRQRYDNLKSVVLRRSPAMEYNPQFLDFARFFGFSIHVCNPFRGNEKGRVERIIRDIRVFLDGDSFADLADLNRKFHLWLAKRNVTLHRATGKTPRELLLQERLLAMPAQAYLPRRVEPAVISKTALVAFDNNTYSVPTSCASKAVNVVALPERIEIWFAGSRVACHQRCFGKKQSIQNPLHAEKILERTSDPFKMQRIFALICRMEPVFARFVDAQDSEENRISAAYQIFTLLCAYSKTMVMSAVRELLAQSCVNAKALLSLLQLPQPQSPQSLWPRDTRLLTLNYQERSLSDYDPHRNNLETT